MSLSRVHQAHFMFSCLGYVYSRSHVVSLEDLADSLPTIERTITQTYQRPGDCIDRGTGLPISRIELVLQNLDFFYCTTCRIYIRRWSRFSFISHYYLPTSSFLPSSCSPSLQQLPEAISPRSLLTLARSCSSLLFSFTSSALTTTTSYYHQNTITITRENEGLQHPRLYATRP